MGKLIAAVGGLCLGFPLIAVMRGGERFFRAHPLQRWERSVFFALCAAFPAAGSIYFTLCALFPVAREFATSVHVASALASALFAAIFAWASLGTLYRWPGFRSDAADLSSIRLYLTDDA